MIPGAPARRPHPAQTLGTRNYLQASRTPRADAKLTAPMHISKGCDAQKYHKEEYDPLPGSGHRPPAREPKRCNAQTTVVVETHPGKYPYLLPCHRLLSGYSGFPFCVSKVQIIRLRIEV